MTAKERAQIHYRNYIERITEVLKNKKPLDGFLGFGNNPAKHPCHEEFFHALQFELTDIKREQHPSEELKEMMLYMFRMPKEADLGNMVSLMLVAVDGLAQDFVEDLTTADAAEVYDFYKKLYPKKWERLPNQEKLMLALKKRAGR